MTTVPDPPATAELAEFRPVDARSASPPRDVPARPDRAPTGSVAALTGRSARELEAEPTMERAA